jgi:hypothetical protein
MKTLEEELLEVVTEDSDIENIIKILKEHIELGLCS